MAVTCKYGDGASALPIPQSHRLVITAGNDPWELFVEFYSPDIVQVTSECEHAFLRLVVPDFNLMIITTTDEHGLRLMEEGSSYRAIMLFKLVQKGLSSIVK